MDIQREIDHFIAQELRKWKKPQRKGKHRGELIGFFKQKLHASLLALTDKSLKDQAKAAGVSYEVLRVWRTELEFKKTMSDHWTAFNRHLETVKFFAEPQKLEDGLSLLEWSERQSQLKEYARNLLQTLLKRKAENRQQAISRALEILKDEAATREQRQGALALLEGVKEAME